MCVKCYGRDLATGTMVELFEARKPRETAVISEIDGIVEISESRNMPWQIVPRTPGPLHP